ncbi:MAG: HAD-IA family hydrolase, partial [Myxococcales bacterium]|nr:HAD-IA family hydrolase [Myxococcales bacterium]
SNYPEWYAWIEAKLGLSQYLGWTFVSCLTGLRKPDPRAYEQAARTLSVQKASELWFIDDREENVVAAQEAGLSALRFEDASQLRAALYSAQLL